MRDKITHVQTKHELKEKLKQVAQEYNISLNAVINIALTKFVKEWEHDENFQILEGKIEKQTNIITFDSNNIL